MAINKEKAKDLLKRKERAYKYAKHCFDVGCCNYDEDTVLLYQDKKWWDKVKKVAK